MTSATYFIKQNRMHFGIPIGFLQIKGSRNIGTGCRMEGLSAHMYDAVCVVYDVNRKSCAADSRIAGTIAE